MPLDRRCRTDCRRDTLDELIEPGAWERLRDPTHTDALTEHQLHQLLDDSGLRLQSSEHHDQVLDLERWLCFTQRWEIAVAMKPPLVGS